MNRKMILLSILAFTISLTSVVGQGISQAKQSDNFFTKKEKLSKSYPKNEVSLNLFGHGIFYSFGYNRNIYENQKSALGVQTNIAYYPPSSGIRSFLLPLALNHKFKINQHSIVAGYGLTLVINKLWQQTGIPLLGQAFAIDFLNLKLGYRYDFKKFPFYISPAFTPLVEIEIQRSGQFIDSRQRELNYNFIPFGGLEFGWRF